jgi:hypothetical protein
MTTQKHWSQNMTKMTLNITELCWTFFIKYNFCSFYNKYDPINILLPKYNKIS